MNNTENREVNFEYTSLGNYIIFNLDSDEFGNGIYGVHRDSARGIVTNSLDRLDNVYEFTNKGSQLSAKLINNEDIINAVLEYFKDEEISQVALKYADRINGESSKKVLPDLPVSDLESIGVSGGRRNIGSIEETITDHYRKLGGGECNPPGIGGDSWLKHIRNH